MCSKVNKGVASPSALYYLSKLTAPVTLPTLSAVNTSAASSIIIPQGLVW